MFENGLNPGVILSGTATTNPTLPVPMNTQLLQNAQAGQAQQAGYLDAANVGLTQAETQKTDIGNQLARMGLINAQALGRSYQKLYNDNPNHQTPQNNTPPAPQGGGDNTPDAQTFPVGPNGPVAGSSPAPSLNISTPGQPGYNNPPGPGMSTGNNPAATPKPAPAPIDAKTGKPLSGLTADAQSDWWMDADGKRVDHLTGPAYSPNGRPNLYSEANINRMYDTAIADAAQNGGNPSALITAKQEALKNAQDFDKTAADILKAKEEADKARQEYLDKASAHVGDSAYKIWKSTTPAETIQTEISQQPDLLRRLGITDASQLLGSDGQLTQEAIAKLAPLAVNSGQAKDRSTIDLQAAQRAQDEMQSKKTAQETLAGYQKQGKEAADAFNDAQTNVTASQIAAAKSDRAVQLAAKVPNGLGSIGATWNDIQNKLGNDPQWAELKAYLAKENVGAMMDSLRGGNRLTGAEYAQMKDQLANGKMPAETLQRLLSYSNDAAHAQVQQASQYRDNIKAAVERANPRMDTTYTPAPTGLPGQPQEKVQIGPKGTTQGNVNLPIIKPNSPEYAALPKGAQYLGIDGQYRIKGQ